MRMKNRVLETRSAGREGRGVAMETNLEEALDLAGVGKYQVFHCALMLSSLASAVLELIGIAFILPAASCDLNVPENLKGLITSLPNIGIILTAFLWGRAADRWGRKPVLLISCVGGGVFGAIASLMPTLLTYALCKFVGSLFIACPSSLGFAYAGELVPRERRDIALLIINGFLMLSTTFSPLLAWGILAADWRYSLGSLTLRPWRLLTAVYAAPLLFTALFTTQASESPKFLMTRGKSRQALEVIKHIYSKNTGMLPEEFSVTSLKPPSQQKEILEDGSEESLTPAKRRDSALALLRPPHLKWMALTGFLMFGAFSLLNGLFLFATDTINTVMQDSEVQVSENICTVINKPAAELTQTNCGDSIAEDVFLIMVATTAAYGAVVLVACLCPLSKKTLLVSMYLTVGTACLLAGVVTQKIIAAAAMSALQLTALAVGPLTAYAVDLFPTSLRGLAVGSVLMCGRIGSLVGANAAGYFLAVACGSTFYGFTALLFSCAALSLLLPKTDTKRRASEEDISTRSTELT